MGSTTIGSLSSTRLYSKGPRASKKKDVTQYSDFYEDEDDELQDPAMAPRSISLTALNSGQVPLEPRMAQLETLEAKMASIEVSLSTSPRKRKSGTYSSLSSAIIHGSNSQLSDSYIKPKTVDLLRHAFKDKENLNIINSAKGKAESNGSQKPVKREEVTYSTTAVNGGNSGNSDCNSNSNSSNNSNNSNNNSSGNSVSAQTQVQPLTEKKRLAAQAQDRLVKLKAEAESKRHAVNNIKLALDRLDVSDNIDMRIQQAELEYQLGREELNLLTIMEESRNIQACLEEETLDQTREDRTTIFNYVQQNKQVSIHAVEINYDPKSPRFGAGPRDNFPGLYVEWATEDSQLLKGDRLLEINGKLVIGMKSKDDMSLLLSVSPEPAQMVLLRNRRLSQTSEHLMLSLRDELNAFREKAGEAERTRDSFRSDNLRLTHRISYLEEQVAELLAHAGKKDPPCSSANSNPNMTPRSPNINKSQNHFAANKSELQLFQKGPQVTTLVANLPGLDVCSSNPPESSLPTIRPKTINMIKNDEVSSEKSMDVKSTKSLDLGKPYIESFVSKHFRRKKHNHMNQNINGGSVETRGKDINNSADSLDIIQGYIKETKDNIHLHQRKKSDSILYSLRHSSKYSVENGDPAQSVSGNAKQHVMSSHNVDNSSADEVSSRNHINGQLSDNCSMSEHRTQYLRNARNTLMEYAKSETNAASLRNRNRNRNQFLNDSHRLKSSDCDSEPGFNSRPNIHQMINSLKNKQTYDYTSDYSPNLRQQFKNCTSRDVKLQTLQQHPSQVQKPIPPKKPIRLSISRAASLQSVESAPPQTSHQSHCTYEVPSSSKKPLKRNHKGEAPPIPGFSQHTLSHVIPPHSHSHPHSMTKNYISINPTEKWC